MKKQKLSLGLSLVLVLSSSLVVASNRANASPFQSLGSNVESSGFSGDSFVPNLGAPQLNLVPGLDVQVSRRGEISVPPEVQARVNGIANDIISEDPGPTPDRCLSPVDAVLRGGPCLKEGKVNIQSTLESYNVSPQVATVFVESITNLLADSSVNITQLNLAINNWNNIVKQLNPTDLQKVKANPEFEKLTRHLKRLRAGLKRPR